MKSQLTSCFSLESGVIVLDLKRKQFLEDAPDSDFTEQIEHAFVFTDFNAALDAGRLYCGESGFKVLCFGEATQTKPSDIVIDNVVF